MSYKVQGLFKNVSNTKLQHHVSSWIELNREHIRGHPSTRSIDAALNNPPPNLSAQHACANQRPSCRIVVTGLRSLISIFG